jgi:hypothetical protein
VIDEGLIGEAFHTGQEFLGIQVVQVMEGDTIFEFPGFLAKQLIVDGETDRRGKGS